MYAADVVSYDIEPPLQHRGIEARLKNWANVFSEFESATYAVRWLVTHDHVSGPLDMQSGDGVVALEL